MWIVAMVGRIAEALETELIKIVDVFVLKGWWWWEGCAGGDGN